MSSQIHESLKSQPVVQKSFTFESDIGTQSALLSCRITTMVAGHILQRILLGSVSVKQREIDTPIVEARAGVLD